MMAEEAAPTVEGPAEPLTRAQSQERTVERMRAYLAGRGAGEGGEASDDTPAESEERAATEAEAEPVEGPDDTEAEATAETDTDAPVMLLELAETFEVAPEDLYRVEVPYVGADGSTKTKTIGELQDFAQRIEGFERDMTAFGSERTQWQEARAAQEQQFVERLQQAEALRNHLTSILLPDSLQQTNPAEYLMRERELQRLAQEASGVYEKSVAEHRERLQAETQAHLQREAAALLEAIPEWKDEGRATKEKRELAQWLVSQGFQPEEVARASDHRLLKIALRAYQYEQLKAGAPEKTKRVRSLPRMVRGGQAVSAAEANNAKKDELRDRMRKRGGRREDVAAFLAESIKARNSQ